ncbi:hypothetical protein CRE_24685 [Caenorhabditis remanei]|uniref:C-type lectin domain-containing protein n=1 Tax=Caenorhabditis remanei TaxID=31234 RepID=E3N3T7_CAERE|nr:hypothetical protein CRE_24685 [Caenorhabditis remanei]
MFQLKHLVTLSVLLIGVASRGCFDADDKEISGFCYKFVNQKLTFEDARDWCHYKDPVTQSYLAYIQNQFTANFLASYGKTIFGSTDATFWIGLSRERNWMPFTWDNGYQLGQSWSNFDGQIKQNYVAERVSNAKWTTFAENQTNYFVCSYDPTDPPTFAPKTPTRPTTTTTTTTTTIGPTTTELCSTDDRPEMKRSSYKHLHQTVCIKTDIRNFKIPLIESTMRAFQLVLLFAALLVISLAAPQRPTGEPASRRPPPPSSDSPKDLSNASRRPPPRGTGTPPPPPTGEPQEFIGDNNASRRPPTPLGTGTPPPPPSDGPRDLAAENASRRPPPPPRGTGTPPPPPTGEPQQVMIGNNNASRRPPPPPRGTGTPPPPPTGEPVELIEDGNASRRPPPPPRGTGTPPPPPSDEPKDLAAENASRRPPPPPRGTGAPPPPPTGEPSQS